MKIPASRSGSPHSEWGSASDAENAQLRSAMAIRSSSTTGVDEVASYD